MERSAEVKEAFGIDIGGSGIKGGRVDLLTGKLLTERLRIPTPRPATPDAVMDVAAQVVKKCEWTGPVGCAFPAVVRQGIVYSAANVDKSWIGTDGQGALSSRIGWNVHMLNDADAAGIAEMQYGAASEFREQGVVVLLTFGTGIGSAVFVDGRLHPNTELGHLELDGHDAETRAAARLREDKELSWEKWIERVQCYLSHLESLLWPDLIVFGGGISKHSGRFLPEITTRAPLVPAQLQNNAGIAGAAFAAHQALG